MHPRHDARLPAALRRTATRTAALLLLAVIAGAPAGAQEPAEAETSRSGLDVRERVAVRESGVLLDLPGLKARAIEKLQPDDLVVRQDDRLLRPTRIAALDEESEPWTVLVYVDALLARHRTVELAMTGLAASAETLAELGPVSVVVAGAEDQAALEGGRSPEGIADALRGVAASRVGTDTLALLRQDLDRRAIEDVYAEELAFLRERADRLLVEGAATCALPPCLLLHVSDGFELAPSAAYRGVPLQELSRNAGGGSHSAIAEDLVKGLSAQGWTVLTLPLEPTETVSEPRARRGVGTDFDAWKAETGGVQTGSGGGSRNRYSGLPEQALDVYTQPRLEPLQAEAAATAGAALRITEQIEPELDRLFGRWWLFYLVEDEVAVGDAIGGGVATLDVAWAERSDFQERRQLKKRLGFAPEEEPLRVQRWARTPAPLLLTEARLRSLRRGRFLVGDLDLRAGDPAPGDDVVPVPVGTPPAVRFEATQELTRIRISGIGPAGSIRHEERTLEVADRTDGLVEVELPVWARRSPAILQDVSSGRWAVLTR